MKTVEKVILGIVGIGVVSVATIFVILWLSGPVQDIYVDLYNLVSPAKVEAQLTCGSVTVERISRTVKKFDSTGFTSIETFTDSPGFSIVSNGSRVDIALGLGYVDIRGRGASGSTIWAFSQSFSEYPLSKLTEYELAHSISFAPGFTLEDLKLASENAPGYREKWNEERSGQGSAYVRFSQDFLSESAFEDLRNCPRFAEFVDTDTLHFGNMVFLFLARE